MARHTAGAVGPDAPMNEIPTFRPSLDFHASPLGA